MIFFQQHKASLQRALLLAFSAWISFVIAVLLGVDNPYWAAMPVWVIAQSTRGLLFERAIYRVMGTVIGAAVGLLILLTANAVWQLLLMTLMIFISAGSVQLMQGVRGYMMLLSGITVSVVVLPALLSPEQGLDLAWARIQSTFIGVVVGTFLTGIGTPKNPRQQFYKQVREVAADTVQTAVLFLTEQKQPKIEHMLRLLSIRISELEAQAESTAAGSVDGHKRNAYVEALLFAALETIAAAAQLQAQLQRGRQISPQTIAQLHAFSTQFRQGAAVPGLRRQDPEDLPDKVSLARLRRALGQMKRAEEALFADKYPFWRSGLPLRRFNPARDWITARRNAYLCASLGFAAGLATYLSQNTAVELAATGVCIFSLILSSMPRPHLHVRYLITGVFIGAVLAGLYRYGLQPYVQDPYWMVLSLLPFMLLGGLARTYPKTEIPALDTTMCFLLASQFGMPAVSLMEVIQASSALILGAAIISLSFALLPRHTEQWGRVLLQQLIYEVRLAIEQRPPKEVSLWRARMARHVLTLRQWMGAQTPKGLLALINFGYSVIAWQRLTATGSVYEQVGLQIQQELMRFDLYPDQCQRALVQMAEYTADSLIADALHDMAAALNEAKPILLFLHKPLLVRVSA